MRNKIAILNKQRTIGILWTLFTVVSFVIYYLEFRGSPWGYNTKPFLLKTTPAQLMGNFAWKTMPWETQISLNIAIHAFLLLLCAFLIFNIKFARQLFLIFLTIILVCCFFHLLMVLEFERQVHLLPNSLSSTPLVYRTYSYIAIITASCLVSGYFLYRNPKPAR